MDSPFDRSDRTVCSSPATPTPAPPSRPAAAAPPPDYEARLETVPTVEIQHWMTTIEQCLSEVCSVAAESKMNSDQKLRVTTLCRKVGHGSSQMAVQYQSLKLKTIQINTSYKTLKSELDLSKQLQDLKSQIEETAKPSSDFSFADMVKKGTNKFIQPSKISSVTIYPNDKQKTSEETKSLVQKIICPEKMKLHVRSLHKTRNGGVTISTDTKEDIAKLKQSVQLKNSGLTIEETYKRKPRVVVIGVPTSMQDNEVLKCVYQQNLTDKLEDIDLESFLNSVKLSHKSGRKEAETVNYVIEVTAAIRKALISNDRVFINWSSCPVRDFTLVTRCFKCQQYGHAAKSCREATHTCGHCGELDHSIKECPKKDDQPKCATCLRFKKPSNHSTGAADCPAKIMAEKRYINSIDYGGA